MGGLSRAQAALATAAGIGILVVGFLVGSAIGDGGDSPSPDGSSPSRIATRDSSVDVPTLGQAKQIPTLAAEEQPAASTTEEGAGSTFTPSSQAGEEEPVEEARTPPETVQAEPEPQPEVTVAPNG